MLRALGAQGIVLDLGPVPASDRRLLPALLRDLRDALPASSRILIVVPPIHDRASQRAAAGYDLRDLSRPATLVLRAFGGKHAERRARIRSHRSAGTSGRCATRWPTPRVRR